MSGVLAAAVFDASVWVSVFLPQDAHHKLSQRWLQAHRSAGNPSVAPILLLAELAGGSAQRTGDGALAQRAMQQVLRIPGLRLVAINRQIGTLAAMIAANGRLRSADTCYLAVAQQLHIPLVTWDQEQLAYARSINGGFTPRDLLPADHEATED